MMDFPSSRWDCRTRADPTPTFRGSSPEYDEEGRHLPGDEFSALSMSETPAKTP